MSRPLWTGSLWLYLGYSRVPTCSLVEWTVLAAGLAPGISPSLAAIVIPPRASLRGSGASQPPAQCFLGALEGQGLQGPYKRSWQQGA